MYLQDDPEVEDPEDPQDLHGVVVEAGVDTVKAKGAVKEEPEEFRLEASVGVATHSERTRGRGENGVDEENDEDSRWMP
jgi:hypothetical protein